MGNHHSAAIGAYAYNQYAAWPGGQFGPCNLCGCCRPLWHPNHDVCDVRVCWCKDGCGDGKAFNDKASPDWGSASCALRRQPVVILQRTFLD